jgi:hypothetical protein
LASDHNPGVAHRAHGVLRVGAARHVTRASRRNYGLDPCDSRFEKRSLGRDFSGTADGVSFGPLNEVALYEFDGQGVGTMTIDGLRIIGFDTMSVTDDDNYSLANVTLRRAHWAVPAGYVDMSFQGCSVVNGRPSADSRVTVWAPNSSIAVVVTSSSASTVVYAVTATVNGASVSYTVTATYPASGAPSYTVVATPN